MGEPLPPTSHDFIPPARPADSIFLGVREKAVIVLYFLLLLDTNIYYLGVIQHYSK